MHCGSHDHAMAPCKWYFKRVNKIKNKSFEELETTIYTASSPLANPLKLLGEILSDIWKFRELIGILFIRDLKGAYRQTYFGYAWILVPPLANTAAWYYLTSQELVKISDTPIPYPAFVMIGQIIWGTFTSAFYAPQNGFNSGNDVFMRLKVPPEAFIANAIANVLFDLSIRSLLILAVFIVFWDNLTLSWTALLFPLGLMVTILLGISLGLFLIPIGSLYSDVGKIVGMVLPFLMYTTPVIFPLAKEGGLANTLMNLNPLSHVIEVTRGWLTMGTASTEYVISFFMLLPVTLLLGGIGLIILRVAMPHLIVRFGM